MTLEATERANASPFHAFDHRLAGMRGAALLGATERRTDD